MGTGVYAEKTSSKQRRSQGMVAEYRRILGDDDSADVVIQERMEYLVALCRNVIRNEIKHHLQSKQLSVNDSLCQEQEKYLKTGIQPKAMKDGMD